MRQPGRTRRAAKQKAQLEAEKAELRTRLLKQFNAILQTRDTARGLIVNMSDVLFDTGKVFAAAAGPREAGEGGRHRLRHPGLKLDVEGHTDSVGGDDYNQKLSEQRGKSVREYLTQQGMQSSFRDREGASAKLSQWLPTTLPMAGSRIGAWNLVISGEVIGTEIGTPIAAR